MVKNRRTVAAANMTKNFQGLLMTRGHARAQRCVQDDRANILTVIANERYEQYVRMLQAEISGEHKAEIGARFGKPYKELVS